MKKMEFCALEPTWISGDHKMGVHTNGKCQTESEPIGTGDAAVELLHDGKHYQIKHNPSPLRKWMPLILSLVALLLGTAVFLYVVVTATNQSTERSHGEKIQFSSMDLAQVSSPEVCCDCLRLVKNPYAQLVEDPLLKGLTKRKFGDVMQCCAQDFTQMSAMLAAVARRQDTIKDALPEVNAGTTDSSSVFVHKYMTSESMNRLTGYSVVNFNPNNNHDTRERSQGAKVLEDGIIILTAGMYHVYSNIFFNLNETGREDHNQTWSSHVHRTRPQSTTDTGILLSSVHTRCYNCIVDKQSIFTGGVFQLQPGDVIRVFLSDVGLVHFNHISSYVGLTKLNR